MTDAPYPTSASAGDGFRPAVWAPRAERVELVLGEADGAGRTPMRAGENGWWHVDAGLSDGARYAFALDGGEPRPDPRSARQPDGVHAASAAFDARAHAWGDEAWRGRDVRESIVYEMHVGTFTAGGTLDSAIERLDHLVELGADMIEVMPLAAFAGRHGWGYDGVALYAVHEAYGGPAAFKRFVDAAHARGIAVCLDVVYNHLGPSGNYLGVYGPYFTDRHETPWGQAVNLDDEGSAEVRAFVIDNACRWFEEFHVDALRLDAVHALVDDSDVHLLAELSGAVGELSGRLGRPLSLIAESDMNDARMVAPTAAGGLGMSAQWADDVHHAIRAFLTGERHGWLVDFGSVATLEKALTRVFVHDGDWSEFRGKSWGAPVPRDVDARRFVAFGTTHDQVGNRAIGDRPSAVLDGGGLAAMAALVLFSPFTPMIFMGEEWGATTPWQFFTDHREPELAEAIRQGRGREFDEAARSEVYGHDVEVPDPQAIETFERSRLDWAERDDDPSRAKLLAWNKALIGLRRSEPALADRSLDGLRLSRADTDSDADAPDWIMVHRAELRLLITRAAGDARVTVPLDVIGAHSIVVAWDEATTRLGSDNTVSLPARSAVLLRLAG